MHPPLDNRVMAHAALQRVTTVIRHHLKFSAELKVSQKLHSIADVLLLTIEVSSMEMEVKEDRKSSITRVNAEFDRDVFRCYVVPECLRPSSMFMTQQFIEWFNEIVGIIDETHVAFAHFVYARGDQVFIPSSS